MLNYFIDYDFSMFIGLVKFATSITMTIFYYLLYKVFEDNKDNKLILVLVVSRVFLCLIPGNGWFTNSGNYYIGLIRNIPFIILGSIVIKIFYEKRKNKNCKHFWLYTLLSFAFYIPVVVGASFIPMFGMFMIPKTVCYMLLINDLRIYSKEC